MIAQSVSPSGHSPPQVDSKTFTTTKSQEIMAEARNVMPGGVSSPVRAFKSVGGEPVVFDRVKGSKAYDVDGNEYVDYVGAWGPVRCASSPRVCLAASADTNLAEACVALGRTPLSSRACACVALLRRSSACIWARFREDSQSCCRASFTKTTRQ